MQMISAARAEIGIFDGAPYGYYLVNDRRGEQKILAYFDGSDVHTVLSRALEKDRGSGTGSGLIAPRASASSASSTESIKPDQRSQPAVLPTTATAARRQSLTDLDVENGRVPTNVPRISRITQVDTNPLKPVPARGIEGSLYSVLLSLDPIQYPDHKGLDYLLPVDTAETSVWFFCEGFRCIESTASTPGVWPSHGYRAWEVRRTISIPQGRPAFSFDRLPEYTKNETAIRYYDGGVVYVRAFPEDHVLVEVPCWDREHGRSSSVSFPLPCVLAYAANMMVARQAYDGNFGLAIHGAGGVLNSYSQALAKARHVHKQYSVFLIRLLHPEALKVTTNVLVRSFVSFSRYFPCTPAVEFSRAIYFHPSEKDGSHCKWGLRVEGLTLLIPGRVGDERITINAVESLRETYFDATLDSANGTSVLPASVVREIQAKWLLNNPAINSGNPYCGPEREALESCDILFTFRSVKDNARVEFRCNAARFLRSNVRLPWHQLGALNLPPTATQLQQYRACPLMSTEGRCVLGINFYWTAFVEHWSTAMGSAGMREEPPYIRLAPQRVIEQGRVTCDDYEFSLPQGVVSRNIA
ncbi:hypothetical protein K466DRAFT_591511 [Polyporus arcularius HHB13444]|uniref:Uncharacterized protein n=1 Tax=Polyporus arcularius HHB13444 TaxID=1314778 RepID=A0A5C3NWU5_9APHY|nr:hypothetical protein K466DRAFT_591511 [Polyporus arcularius HHB13444]